ncbi:MAG: hypothetical protein HQL48_00865 [Gammaproteobacteria bacterium]|nr:hypothetical protein [Gammaproteobacteria bacterium]
MTAAYIYQHNDYAMKFTTYQLHLLDEHRYTANAAFVAVQCNEGMDAEGTSPRVDEDRTMHDCMDAGQSREQLPRSNFLSIARSCNAAMRHHKCGTRGDQLRILG